MSDKMPTLIFWVTAAVMLAVGSAMTFNNLSKVDEIAARFKKKNVELKILKGLAADLARYETAKQKMDKLVDKHPQPLNGLLETVLPGSKAEVRDSRKELVAGWTLRQKEISLNEVPVGKVMEFIGKAESQQIPWCLTKCVVRSATRSAGTGQVVLQMEAVEKTE